MKALAFLIGALLIGLGTFGLWRPEDVISFGYRMDTPAGLCIAAALRLVIGLVLVAAASSSRFPKTLRVAGGVIILAGIATPFMGVDRARAALDWVSSQGDAFTRLLFCIVITVGAFVIYVMFGKRSTGGKHLAAS